MPNGSSLAFKIATEDWEIDAIHRLNYQAFVEEIPQHQANDDQRLIDRFHDENTYLICLDGKVLAGMMAPRIRRPFSLDGKLPDLDRYLPAGRNVFEMRLLAVQKQYRHGAVLPGLLALAEKFGRERGFDTAIISATTRQLRLYGHIGFTPFGPLVGSADAMFQPMILTYEDFKSKAVPTLQAWRDPALKGTSVNFLPGPVAIHSSVMRAFSQSPISHRSKSVLADFERVRNDLCDLAGASSVEILLGSGTLANDAIAGQLSLLDAPGMILTNGEFGERLADHARRFRLKYEHRAKDWGESLPLEEIEKGLSRFPATAWIWTVHCETSTGVLNDVPALQRLCAARGIKLCLDCVSTIGVVPVDLSGVYLASAVSGKGLGSLAGLAMVFHNYAVTTAPDRLPRYLDLGYYSEHQGVPFTHSSNLLRALQSALRRAQDADGFARKRRLSSWLKKELTKRGFCMVAADLPTSPAVVTIALGSTLSSEKVGKRLEDAGFQLSYRSEYLVRRNWMQICLMGDCKRRDLNRMLETLTTLCDSARVSEAAERDLPVNA